jgi:hypothetical protein
MKFDVRGSVHHIIIHKENPTRCNSVSNFNIPNLYKAQHVSGETTLIIRSLKLHWQPPVLHMWKVVGCAVGGRCQAQYCASPSGHKTVRAAVLKWVNTGHKKTSNVG